MKATMGKMSKGIFALCVLVLVGMFLTSIFAADVKIKEGRLIEGVVFGSWTSTDSNSNTLAVDNVYKATSDGFICTRSDALDTNGGSIEGYTDSSNPPTTLRSYCVTGAVYATHPVLNFTMPVRKNDYLKVTKSGTGTPTIYWLPIGNGSCEKQ